MLFKELQIGDIFKCNNRIFVKIGNELDGKSDINCRDLPYTKSNCLQLENWHYCTILPNNSNCELVKKVDDI